jgi:hypothetical protein
MGSSISKDVAICFVLFNPVQSKRLLMNLLYIKNMMDSKGYPTFTLELVLGKNKPELTESKNVFIVHGDSIMFHKEKLCRILEQKVPPVYKKLLFCDGDIIFKDPNWYFNLSKALDKYDIVHPFKEGIWMDLTYTQQMIRRKSSLLSKSKLWDPLYHPGFAWGFRREWYKKVGFFDYAITGSGDTLSCAAWMRKDFSPNSGSIPKQAIEQKYKDYKNLVAKYPPRMSYLDGEVEHLWHGSRKNRKYAERHTMLNSVKNIDSILYTNKEGVFEFSDTAFNTPFLNYFEERKDDDLSIEEIEIKAVNSSQVISSILNETKTLTS